MLRSLYSGVSGSKAHQARMDVIGNNIANVNTTGFKSGMAAFQEVLAQTVRAGSAAIPGGRGSINPMQVGLGVSLSTVDTLFTQGNLESTGSETDLAIQGDGFFVVKDGGRTLYTRDGHFSRGSDGSLEAAASGAKVQGWQAIDTNGDGIQDSIDRSPDLKELNLTAYLKPILKTTANVEMQGNLDPTVATDGTPATWSVSIVLDDNLGREQPFKLTFTQALDTNTPPAVIPNQWELTAAPSQTGGPVVSMLDSTGTPLAGAGTITFDPDTGKFTSADAKQLQFTSSGATRPITVSLNLDALTQVSSDSSVNMKSQDGFPVGTYESLSVNSSGEIIGHYSNQMSMVLGQVALAAFDNPTGLYEAGGNSWEDTPAAGFRGYGSPDSEGRGSISSMHLEMSNVDLSEQFTNMIVTQRGLQANTKVITTSDEILQDLLNIKR